MWRRLIVGIFALAILAWIGIRAVSFKTEARHGSTTYYLEVPRFLKQIPFGDICKPPLYTMEGQDGTKPPMSSMEWGEQRPVTEVVADLDAHFQSLGCTLSLGGDFTVMCPGDLGVRYGARVGDDCTGANVTVFNMGVF